MPSSSREKAMFGISHKSQEERLCYHRIVVGASNLSQGPQEARTSLRLLKDTAAISTEDGTALN